MIRAAVDMLVDQLNGYVRTSGDGNSVVPANIALIESDANGARIDPNHIIVSLVNLEEEGTLKNGRNLQTIGADTFYENRPVFLNLFLLFSAHFTDYPSGLDGLAQVIEFFQANKVFSFRRTPDGGGFPDDPRLQELEIHLDLHTLSFQEINDLWGSLGGKQVPFVLYKARLLPIRARVPLEEVQPVRSIVLETTRRD